MRDVSIDTETYLIAPGMRAPPMVCMSACYSGNPPKLWHVDEPGWYDFLLARLENDCIHGANISYDMCVFGNERPELLEGPDGPGLIFQAYDRGGVIDIQHAERIRDIRNGCFRLQEDENGDMRRKGYSLAELSQRLLGDHMDKDLWRMRYHDFRYVPLGEWPEGAKMYAMTDARSGIRIADKQRDYKYMALLPETCRADFALALMSARGMRTDPAQVQVVKQRTIKAVAELEPYLIGLDWIYPNPKIACGFSKRTNVIKDYLLAQDVDHTYTKTGVELIQNGREHLVVGKSKYLSLAFSALYECGDKQLEAFARYNRLSNLLNTTIRQMELGRLLPIQSRFDAMLATGRTSSSSPNVQNIRTVLGIREIFVARPGYAFVTGDYKAAELHTLAQVCYDQFGKSSLGDALREGKDVHSMMGARLKGGCTYEEFLAAYGAEADALDPFTFARGIGKNCNFMLPGAGGPKRFSEMVNNAPGPLQLTLAEATKAKAQWLAQWEEMPLFFRWIKSCQMPNSQFYYSYIERTEFVRGFCTYAAACNTQFQHLAAAGAKAAMWALTKDSFDRFSPFYGARLVNFVHDELIAEVPLEILDRCARHMVSVMETRFNVYVPDCPTTVDVAAMYAWSKKAKEIRDGRGLLIPYEDRSAAA